jgi:hypothetical protein
MQSQAQDSKLGADLADYRQAQRVRLSHELKREHDDLSLGEIAERAMDIANARTDDVRELVTHGYTFYEAIESLEVLEDARTTKPDVTVDELRREIGVSLDPRARAMLDLIGAGLIPVPLYSTWLDGKKPHTKLLKLNPDTTHPNGKASWKALIEHLPSAETVAEWCEHAPGGFNVGLIMAGRIVEFDLDRRLADDVVECLRKLGAGIALTYNGHHLLATDDGIIGDDCTRQLFFGAKKVGELCANVHYTAIPPSVRPDRDGFVLSWIAEPDWSSLRSLPLASEVAAVLTELGIVLAEKKGKKGSRDRSDTRSESSFSKGEHKQHIFRPCVARLRGSPKN